MRDDENNSAADKRRADRSQDYETKVCVRLNVAVMTVDRFRVVGTNDSGRDQFRELAAKPANRAPICCSGHEPDSIRISYR